MNSNNVVVCARVKPVENNNDEGQCIAVIDDEELELSTFTLAGSKATLNFKMDRVFDSNSSQEDVFNQLVKPMITESLKGYNMTLFSYGQTGSGKTFTMQGIGKEESRGIVYRVVEELFHLLPISTTPISPTKTTTNNNSDNNKAFMALSCLEIYQERLIDLLLPSNSNAHLQRQRSLRIRQRPDGSVWVEKLSDVNIFNLTSFSTHLDSAFKRRATGGHRMNAESSRSHLLIIISLSYPSHSNNDNNNDTNKNTSVTLTSKIHLIDLAGSEMVRKTEASGARLQEAKHINKSLSALGNVIYALTEFDSSSNNTPYIPFRDSKLTRLLKDSLGGNSKTALILTLATGSSNVSESTATLRFGERARQLRTQPRINITDATSTTPNSGTDVDYSVMNAELLEQIQELQSQLLTAQSTITDLQLKAKDKEREIVVFQSENKDKKIEKKSTSLSCQYCSTWCGDVVKTAESDANQEKGQICGLHEVCLEALKQSFIAMGIKTAATTTPTVTTTVSDKNVLVEDIDNSQSISHGLKTPHIQTETDEEVEVLNNSADVHVACAEGETDEDDGDYYRCGVCLMTKEESDKWTLDTGERLGDMFGCDGNCGCLFHVRCVGLIGEGGQYTLPEQEWYCNICSPDVDMESFVEDLNIDIDDGAVSSNVDTDTEEINSSNNHTNTTPLSPQTHVPRLKAEAAISRLRSEHDHMRRDRNAVLRQWQGEKELNKAQEQRRLEMKKNFDKELYEAKKEIELLRNECKDYRFKNERLEMKISKSAVNEYTNPTKYKQGEQEEYEDEHESENKNEEQESHVPVLPNPSSSVIAKSRLRGQLERDVAAATSIYSSTNTTSTSISSSSKTSKESSSSIITDDGSNVDVADPLQVPVYYEETTVSATSAHPEDDSERGNENENGIESNNNNNLNIDADLDVVHGKDQDQDVDTDIKVDANDDEDSGDYRELLESAGNGVWNRGRWRNLLNTPTSKQPSQPLTDDNTDDNTDVGMKESSHVQNQNNQILLSKSLGSNELNNKNDGNDGNDGVGDKEKGSAIPKPWLSSNTSLSRSLNSNLIGSSGSGNNGESNERPARKGRRPPPDTTTDKNTSSTVETGSGSTSSGGINVSLSDRINSLLEDVEQESEDMRLLKQRMKARDEQRAEILAERGPLSQVKRREDGDGQRRRHPRHSKAKEEQ